MLRETCFINYEKKLLTTIESKLFEPTSNLEHTYFLKILFLILSKYSVKITSFYDYSSLKYSQKSI